MSILSAADLDDLADVADSAMNYSCTISRATSPGRDGDGHPLPLIWNSYGPVLDCLVLQNRGQSNVTGEQVSVGSDYNFSRYELLLPLGTDIKVTDRVSTILDRNGVNLDSTIHHYEIKEVVPRQSHLALTLNAVR